ncbi:MAG: hypothetical protein U5L09_16420 [Bacteroidales bacterium]|nr:hypothetical protein [Bacteroidales bacterium]
MGLIAASEISYSFVNDTYVWGAYDNMWPFCPTMAPLRSPAALSRLLAMPPGKYYLQRWSWPYNTNNKEVTYHLFHHHGGAFLTVYSEMPQELDVVHNDVLVAPTSLRLLPMKGR